MEDGFLRSISHEYETISIVFDNTGIHYDATKPSRIEGQIKRSLSDIEERRATSLIKQWRDHRLSKYNSTRKYEGNLYKSYILVIDQTFGDLSRKYGMASAASFGFGMPFYAGWDLIEDEFQHLNAVPRHPLNNWFMPH